MSDEYNLAEIFITHHSSLITSPQSLSEESDAEKSLPTGARALLRRLAGRRRRAGAAGQAEAGEGRREEARGRGRPDGRYAPHDGHLARLDARRRRAHVPRPGL